MSIDTARQKFLDAVRDYHELKEAKGDHAECDRKLSSFLDHCRAVLDHLSPNKPADDHEVKSWSSEKRSRYSSHYSGNIEARWDSTHGNEDDVLNWLNETKNTDKRDTIIPKSHQDANLGRINVPNMREPNSVETLPRQEGENHYYFFEDSPAGYSDLPVLDIAKWVLSDLKRILVTIEEEYLENTSQSVRELRC